MQEAGRTHLVADFCQGLIFSEVRSDDFIPTRRPRRYPCEEELERLLDGLDLQPVRPKCLELLTT